MRWLLPLLSFVVACPSFREAYLSELEAEDAGDPTDARVELDADLPDAAALDATSELPDADVAVDAPLDAAVSVDADDVPADAGEKSCCQLWQEFRDRGLIDHPLDPWKLFDGSCPEKFCKPPPSFL